MKFTLSWLKDHLETDATLEQICERLTAIGLEVEDVDDKAAYKPFVIARVLSAEKHPEADRLKVLTVDAGPEVNGGKPLQVVCGAPNARAGLVGVFGGAGTFVPGSNFTLGKATQPRKVVVLGEPFAVYHAAGLALVLGGIWLAERR